MKVVLICQRDSLENGGAAKVAVEQASRLQKYGVDAHVIFAYGDRGDLSSDHSIQVSWIQVESNRSAITGMYRLWQKIDELKPDIIHHHDGLSWTHVVTNLFRNTTRVGHAHSNGPQIYANLKVRISHRIQIATYDYLIGVSRFTLEAWVNRGFPADKTFLVPNGVEIKNFSIADQKQRLEMRRSLTLPENAKFALSVGRLHTRMKGTDDFIRIIALLDEDWHGIVAGAGPDLEDLKQLASQLGVSHRVHFCGLVNPVTKAYHAADILIVTSHFEPFGLMIIEALSCGLPVAGFECEGGATALMNESNSIIQKQRNPELLANSIREYFETPLPEQAARSEAGREMVKSNYTWEYSTEKMARAYFEISKA